MPSRRQVDQLRGAARRPTDRRSRLREAAPRALRRERPGEVVPLRALAAQLPQPVELEGLLDALGDRPSAGGRGPSTRSHSRAPSRRHPPSSTRDEVAGDLDGRHREALEVAERRVAGPEVVDRDPEPETAQGLELGDRVRPRPAAASSRSPRASPWRGRRRTLARSRSTSLHEVRLLELTGRDVDADLRVRAAPAIDRASPWPGGRTARAPSGRCRRIRSDAPRRDELAGPDHPARRDASSARAIRRP